MADNDDNGEEKECGNETGEGRDRFQERKSRKRNGEVEGADGIGHKGRRGGR